MAKQRGGGGAQQQPPEARPQALVPHEPSEGMAVEFAAMIRVAMQYPRDEQEIKVDAMEELEGLSADEASWLWYSIPYRDKCKGERDCPHDGPHGTDVFHKVFVEGPSVHAALELARRWRHVSSGWREIENSEERVVVEGAFMDWQNNVRTNSVMIVAKYLTLRNGSVIRLSEDRLAKAVAAAGQKARRNAILAGMPRGLVQRYWQRAKEITQAPSPTAAPQKPIEDRRKAMVALFADHGVTVATIEGFIGKPLAEMTEEHLTRLRGIAGAIRDGFVEPEEAFAVQAEAPAAPEQRNLGDVIKGKAD